MTAWPRLALGLAVAAWIVRAAPVRADGPSFDASAALKGAVVVSHAPDAPLLYPERDAAVSLWRLRISPEVRYGERFIATAAYEQRVKVAAQGALLGLGVLASEAPAPYRVTQLDWELAAASGHAWRHEIDRLAATAVLGRVDVTVGRQAVGWGRGVAFGAVDLFAPFTPLEADREWRRGVDAIRAEVAITDKISTDAVAALGESVDESAFAARVRGYRGPVDVELIGGWRARDLMAGVTSSAAVGDAELHGELAAFRAPEPLPAGAQIGTRGAIKAVLGGSYRLAVGSGLSVSFEYHYSGFGARRAYLLVPLLADPAFRARLERGDTQILGRHALALAGAYEVAPELAVSVQWIISAMDGSGVVAPAATATLGDRLSVAAALYLPHGAAPVGMTIASDYGAAALSGFVQLQATY